MDSEENRECSLVYTKIKLTRLGKTLYAKVLPPGPF